MMAKRGNRGKIPGLMRFEHVPVDQPFRGAAVACRKCGVCCADVGDGPGLECAGALVVDLQRVELVIDGWRGH